jgi:menaquinone-9 beta-reductase
MKVTENDIQELVIVGAGPAGLTASLYAHRLGIPHLLIEKTQFPKDKICGDGLAPLVFNILDELDISAKEEEIFHQIDEIEFCFSDREKSESYFGKNITKSISLNCRRLFFDNWLKNKLPADSIYYGKVTDVDYRQKHILVQHNNQIKLIRFKQLLLCNGSGKNLLTEHKHRNENNIAFASRAYITLDDAGSKNYFEFFEDIAPGYFWMFPVSKKILNTGVYFHDNSRLNNLYEIHEKKLREHLNLKEHVTYNRWPLRIFPSVQSEKTYNYVIAIGDANHSIDPLLGHGIDVAMLEAREQIIALKMSGKFTKESFIYSEIEKLGKASVKYKFILSEKHPATVRKIEFQNFLTHTATFYRTVNLYLKEHPISNILLK